MKVTLMLFGLLAMAFGRPQDVDVSDILGAANAARYGGNEEPADSSLVDDVFGGDGKTNNNNNNNNGNGNGSGGPYANGEDELHVNEIVDTSYEECSYYADQGYKCVPYYTCEDGEIVTDGGGLIDIRSSFSAILDPGSSKCEGYLEVCCRHPDYSTNAPIVKTTTKKPTTPKPRVYVPQCGRRNIGGIGVRIQNDKYKGSTQFGEWPHMCAILESKPVADADEINLYVCGASLIAPGVVLTGAHCVHTIDPKNIKIRCGEWDTQQQVEPKVHQDRYAKSVRMHPLFDPRNLKNDFALLFTDEDFILDDHIDTICLPDNIKGIFDYEQEDCFATGWGKDKFGKKGEYQVIMKQVQMDTVESGECERRLRRTRLGSSFNLDKSFICAGGEKDKDTCKGDGGGPLVCPRKQDSGYGGEPRYVQAGIIAWGIDCGVEGNPGVYANVADGLCFIDWATQCEKGVPGYFNINGCQNWALEEIAKLQSQIDKYSKKLDTVTADGSGTPSNLRNLNRKIKKNQALLAAFQSTESICVGGDGGYGNGGNGGDGGFDDIDISSLGRKGATTNQQKVDGTSGKAAAGGDGNGSYGENGGQPLGVVDGDNGSYGENGGQPLGVVDGDNGSYGENGGQPLGVVDGGDGSYTGPDEGLDIVLDKGVGPFDGGAGAVVDPPGPADGY